MLIKQACGALHAKTLLIHGLWFRRVIHHLPGIIYVCDGVRCLIYIC